MRFEHACFDTVSAGIELEEPLALQIGTIPINVDAAQFCFEIEGVQPHLSSTTPCQSARRTEWDHPYERQIDKNGELGKGIASRLGMPVHGTVHAQLPVCLSAASHLLFSIDVHCKMNSDGSKLDNREVYSRHLQWVPLEGQASRFATAQSPVWFNPDIHLATLSAGQRIKALFVACKGEGYEHSKWKAADAFYRVIPTIYTNNDVVEAAVAATRARGSQVDIEEIGDYALKVVAACPQRIPRAMFDSQDHHNPGFGQLRLEHVNACTLCMQCQQVPIPRSIKVPLIEFDEEEKDYELSISTQPGGQPAPQVLSHTLQLLSSMFREIGFTVQKQLRRVAGEAATQDASADDEFMVVKKVRDQGRWSYVALDASGACTITIRSSDHVVKRCLEHELLQLSHVTAVLVSNNTDVNGVDITVQTEAGMSVAEAVVQACEATAAMFGRLLVELESRSTSA
jgi:DNA-directed RNA polymerase subunit L